MATCYTQSPNALVYSEAKARRERNRAMKLPRNLGMVLLAVWLIATGALPLLGITFARHDLVMDVLAIVAGVLLLLGR